MISRQTELSSPSQIGVPRIRMSAACTFRQICGQASSGQPCSVMSGCTPKAMGMPAGRITSTATPPGA